MQVPLQVITQAISSISWSKEKGLQSFGSVFMCAVYYFIIRLQSSEQMSSVFGLLEKTHPIMRLND